MNRIVSIFFLSLIVLLIWTLIALGIGVWYVFTPDRLTAIVTKQSDRYLPYQAEIGRVQLNFFSTFPRLSVQVSHFSIHSPFDAAPSDTLVYTKNLYCVIDAGALWKDRALVVDKFILSDGFVNLFADSLGRSNYGKFLTDFSGDQEKAADGVLPLILLEGIALNNIHFFYADQTAMMNVRIDGLMAVLSGSIEGDLVRGVVAVDHASVSFDHQGVSYLESASIKADIPAELLLSPLHTKVQGGYAEINDLTVHADASVDLGETIIADISFAIQGMQVDDLMKMIPAAYMEPLGDFEAAGTIGMGGTIKGSLTGSELPGLDLKIDLKQGKLHHALFPFPLSGIHGDFELLGSGGDPWQSTLHIGHLEAKTPASTLTTSGRVNDLLGELFFDLDTEVSLLLEEFNSLIPYNMGVHMHGKARGQLQTAFTMSQAMDMAIDKMKLAGNASLDNFSVAYDTLTVDGEGCTIFFSIPASDESSGGKGFVNGSIVAEQLRVAGSDHFGASLASTHLLFASSDLNETGFIADLSCSFDIGSASVLIDTIAVDVEHPAGYFTLTFGDDTLGMPAVYLDYSSNSIAMQMGSHSFIAENAGLTTDVEYDSNQEDVFKQWLVKGYVDIKNGKITTALLPYAIDIPVIAMDFDTESFDIHQGRFVIGQSDFELSGVLNNVMSYARGDSLLRGNFGFSSGRTDLVQIMGLTSGIGDDEAVAYSDNPGINNPGKQNVAEQATGYGQYMVNDTVQDQNNSFAGPYMVPQGMEMNLEVNLREATLGPDTITNVAGNVRVSDGILVLDELTFTTPAADMQLTAMYRTPRKNHLYLGIDYHMFDVDISRLLQMIPDIDTLMPMLRSFEGAGEFHLAVETYLDSLYRMKKSTLRGAASITGQDLVLMDGETFSEIARSLRFSRRAENRVDSLSAEFTIFREEIDVYPFLVVMDRYKAVVAGRHHFDMHFDYHISLVESPLPLRLGIDITGNLDNLQYRLASARYAEFYRPVRRGAVSNYQLELRNIIRDALIRNIQSP